MEEFYIWLTCNETFKTLTLWLYHHESSQRGIISCRNVSSSISCRNTLFSSCLAVKFMCRSRHMCLLRLVFNFDEHLYKHVNWVQKTQDEDKQNKKHNTIFVGHHHTQDTKRKQTKQNHNCTQTNTKNANKTRALLQTTEGNDEPNIDSSRKS